MAYFFDILGQYPAKINFVFLATFKPDKGENEEESEYDDSDDEDFDFCTPEERAAYMKEVHENEAACIVIPQEIFIIFKGIVPSSKNPRDHQMRPVVWTRVPHTRPEIRWQR